MGVDKEAMDIWMFGKPRPDLPAEETMAEYKRRNEMLAEYTERRQAELIAKAPDLIAQAKEAAKDKEC